LRAGRWQGWDPGELLGRELSHSVIGIVGLGRIGERVAELLRGFAPEGEDSARMLYTARSERPRAEEGLGLRRLALEDLVAQADVVTLHVPLGPETHHLVDASLLERFKPGSILVNTSRGGLVDTQALVGALRSGRLAAAGLDVFEHEPSVEPELLALENVVLVPHIGSATGRARDAMARLVAQNVKAVLAGAEPPTPVVR